jgi:hypothetical protein
MIMSRIVAGFSSCLVFRRGFARKCETAGRERLGSQACSIHPGIAGMCYPDKGNHVMEKESRKTVAACPARTRARRG